MPATREIEIDAAPTEVWEALVTEEGRDRWLADDRDVLVELYARSAEEASQVLDGAARGPLQITSLAEESRPPAHASGEAH